MNIKDAMEMSDDELSLAMAQAQGWEDIEMSPYNGVVCGYPPGAYKGKDRAGVLRLPRYETIDSVWHLIYRDPDDAHYQVFWVAMQRLRFINAIALLHGILTRSDLADMAYWLMLQHAAYATRVICVCWLAAQGKVTL